MQRRNILSDSRPYDQARANTDTQTSRAPTHRQVTRAAILIITIVSYALWAFGQQLPLQGEGTGGAVGPSVITFSAIPSTSVSEMQSLLSPEPQAGAQATPNIPSAPLQVRSQDIGGNKQAISNLLKINSSFTTYSEVDVAGSTNGLLILASDGNGTFTVYDFSGNIIKQVRKSDFWCGPSTALPICSSGGFDVDQRVFYDVGAERWIISALWAFGSNPATNVLAVSQTKDPRLGWNLYQFPACGSFDNWDTSDQPHTGFGNQWIVVNSLCTPKNGISGAGLAVFNKHDLYRGRELTLKRKKFLVDPRD